MDKCCCNKMKTCLQFFDSFHPRIGPAHDGDDGISGSLNIDKDGIHISDGWNDIPEIDFNFCPYCGTKLKD